MKKVTSIVIIFLLARTSLVFGGYILQRLLASPTNLSAVEIV